MTEPAIRVEKLGKQYRLGTARARYATLREALVRAAAAPWKRFRQLSGAAPAAATIWALREVSFDVAPGEVVGIIGCNGAGKSTLLKVLSQITEPTEGRVVIDGRIASLLEVGTGFHPELTGRENVFLNGAILGMGRREIAAKFDEIVAFAEVEQFIDTPVKHYSSGMYMRLAFAVAAHLEPDILVVDEVLAVGDAAFQEKCLGKMGEVSRAGRTVLFVSHHMAAVKALCDRAIHLAAGRVVADGPVNEVVEQYLRPHAEMGETGVIPDDVPHIGTGEARLRSVRLTDLAGREVSQVYFRQPFRVSFECEVFKDIPDGYFAVGITALDGTEVTWSCTMDAGGGPTYLRQGMYRVDAEVDVVLLPRRYCLDLNVHPRRGTSIDFVQGTRHFRVMPVSEDGTDSYPWPKPRAYVRAPVRWRVSDAGGWTDNSISTEGRLHVPR